MLPNTLMRQSVELATLICESVVPSGEGNTRFSCKKGVDIVILLWYNISKKEGLYMNINIGLFTIIKNYGVIKNIVANLLPIFYYKERLYINVFIIILYIIFVINIL